MYDFDTIETQLRNTAMRVEALNIMVDSADADEIEPVFLKLSRDCRELEDTLVSFYHDTMKRNVSEDAVTRFMELAEPICLIGANGVNKRIVEKIKERFPNFFDDWDEKLNNTKS